MSLNLRYNFYLYVIDEKTKAQRTYVHSEGHKPEVDFELSLIPVDIVLTIMLCSEPQQIGDDTTERRKTLAP